MTGKEIKSVIENLILLLSVADYFDWQTEFFQAPFKISPKYQQQNPQKGTLQQNKTNDKIQIYSA